jgi:protein tyrosine/serine phosphatase
VTTREHRPGWLDLDGTHNVRDVGGLRTSDGRRVRSRVLLRGDHLENLTPSAAARLRAQTGLRLVVDLRSAWEAPRRGGWADGPEGVGIDHLSLPLSDLTQATEAVRELTGVERLTALYRLMLDASGPALGAVLRRVTTDDHAVPFLVHCAAGKDRTGIMVAVLLRAAGVEPAEILADYAVTGERLPRIRAALMARTESTYRFPDDEPVAEPLPTAPLQAVLDALETAGGAEAFLAERGVSEGKIARWRALLLEDGAT